MRISCTHKHTRKNAENTRDMWREIAFGGEILQNHNEMKMPNMEKKILTNSFQKISLDFFWSNLEVELCVWQLPLTAKKKANQEIKSCEREKIEEILILWEPQQKCREMDESISRISLAMLLLFSLSSLTNISHPRAEWNPKKNHPPTRKKRSTSEFDDDQNKEGAIRMWELD